MEDTNRAEDGAEEPDGGTDATASRGADARGTLEAAEDDSVAKVYYEDGDPVVLAAAFVIEDWPWVVGFDQTGTEGYDYVSIPSERVVAVMSPRYTEFSHNGRRVTAYGVMDGEMREYRDLLPL